MRRLLLKTLNPILMILIACVGVALQTTLFRFSWIEFLQPDCLLILTVFVALRRNFYEGGFLVLVLGLIGQLHSAAPNGVLLLIYMTIFLAIRSMVQWLVVTDHRSLVMVTLASSIAFKLLAWTLLWLLGAPSGHGLYVLTYASSQAVMNALIFWALLSRLDRLDWITFKHPMASRRLDGEPILEEDIG